MATFKQDISKPFSRRLNGLCEVQRWFPAYIKNDGIGGLTVDPVLFYTTFNSTLKSVGGDGLDDESRTAGIRVEMINHDGTTPSGTPTIQILGSGTLDARCVITWEDATKTEFRFVAPSADVKLANVYGAQYHAGAGGMEQATDTSPNTPSMTYSAGPYPVFITLQEFANWLDGNMNRTDKALVDAAGGHISDFAYKEAWLPFGLLDPSTSAFCDANSDPRIDSNNNDPIPAVSKICATLWMPLLYDNNQLDKTQSGATNNNDIVQGAWDLSAYEDGTGNTNTYRNMYNEGMTRFSQQPEDGAEYKWWDDAGDLRTGEYAAFQRTDSLLNPDNQFDYVNLDITPAASSTANPSWRMRSALACFLCDGTYALIGGSIIPYVYDDTRAIGGRDGTSVYSVWNGKAGIANTQSELDNVDTANMSSAQIFPLYDFIQGPLCQPAQGWNWDNDVNNNWLYWCDMTKEIRTKKISYDAGNFPDGNGGESLEEATTKIQPRSAVVRPNPIRAKIWAAGQNPSGGTNTITTSGTAVAVLEVYVDEHPSSGMKNVWKVGMPVNIKFNSGDFMEKVDTAGNPLWRNFQGINKAMVKATGTGNPKPDFRATRYPYTLSEVGGLGTTSSTDNFWSGRSGWWICNKVEALTAVSKSTIVASASGTFTGHKLSFVINATHRTTDTTNMTNYYECEKSYISQGIMGGSEVVYGGKWEEHAGPTYDDFVQTNLNTNGTTPYDPPTTVPAQPQSGGTAHGLGSSYGYGMNRYCIIPVGCRVGEKLYVLGTGLGFEGGIGGASTAPSFANQHWRFPNAATFDPAGYYSGSLGGYAETPSQPSPRGTMLTSGLDDGLVNIPTANSFSGNIVRLSAPQNWGHANFYYSVSRPEGLAFGTFYIAGDMCLATSVSDGQTGENWEAWKDTNPDGYNDSSYQNWNGSFFSFLGNRVKWVNKSLVLLCMSKFDQATGRHAFDHMKPSITTNGRNQVWPIHERVGTKKGYGNFQSLVGWGSENKDKTTVGERYIGETTKTSFTEVGCSPVWLDFEMNAWIPIQKERYTIIEFDTGVPHPLWGRHTHETHVPFNNNVGGFQYQTDPLALTDDWAGWKSTGSPSRFNQNSAWNSEVWFFGGSDVMANTAFDAPTNGGFTDWGSWPFAGVGNTGFGQMGNAIGTGAQTLIAEGYHAVRTVFEESGMTLVIDGNTVGKDMNTNNPVWGLSIITGNIHMKSIQGGNNPIKDSRERQMYWGGAAVNKTDADLMIDSISLRHIPTPAMLPFTVDTVNQQIAGVSKYTALNVEADNIKPSKNMDIRVSICPIVNNVPSVAGVYLRQVEGGTPYTNFDNLNLDFVGGYGSVDLSNLPADAITNGFVIRFGFYVPSSADKDLHPVDWSTTPIIRSWSLEHDIAPTTTLSVIGNTFNGDITPPIDTKVGHIVSFNADGATTDEDRVLTAFKFDFGDGVITEYLALSDQTQQSASMNTAHSYLTAGTYNASVWVLDDNNNATQSATVSIVVANAPPVAVLKSIPSLTRSGTAITLDATDSFDINAGGTISNYTFTFGDGSSAVSNASGTTQHTYATAGEYQATLICTDSDGATSQTASAVIKVIPATLVIPLTFNVRPNAFSRTRAASMNQTAVLDATYPELTDTGQRSDEMTLDGAFLADTANSDIAFVEELMLSGSLVEFLYEDVDYAGNPSGKTFVGRITSFDYEREGGNIGQTPYSMTLVREAGLGV